MSGAFLEGVIILKFENFYDMYEVRRLNNSDVPQIYRLSVGNPLFYQYCPPAVTKESIKADMEALPPGINKEDKYYVGFFDKDVLVAILDLILGYPEKDSAYIGLFMMNHTFQGKGIGSSIISELGNALAQEGFFNLSLAYAKGNPQSEAFWIKNGFKKTGKISDQGLYKAVLMERRLPCVAEPRSVQCGIKA